MAMDHRLPAIFTALFSSVGVILAAYSGASCNFLVRITEYDEDDKTIFDKELDGVSGSFGVLCEHEIFPREGDKYWELSRLFLILGLSLGSLTAALAWAVATFLTPTDTNWRGISIVAALTAVLQVPIFVLFEAEPCLGDLEEIDLFANSNVTTGLGCKLGPGSYLLIASDLFFIGVTVLTQCFDRPKWGLDKDIWKVHKKGDSANNSKKKKKKGGPSKSRRARNDDYYYDDSKNYDDNIHLTSPKAQSIVSSEDNDENVFTSHSRVLPAGEAKREKEESEWDQKKDGKKPRGFFAKLFGFASPTDHLEVPVGETKSMDDEYDYESQLLHNLEIIRVLPQQEEQTQTSTKSSPSPATVPSAEGEEVSIGAYDKLLTKTASKDSSNNNTKIRNIQSFEAVVDDGTTLIPWMPSAAVPSHLVEQHQMIDSPSASLNSSLMCADNSMPDHKPIISSVTDILQDLKCDEIASDPYQSKSPARATSPAVVPRESPSHQFVAPSAAPAPVSENVVAFNGKAPKKARASIVKASLRNMSIFQKKGGYAQMNSDQSSSGGDTETDDESKDNYFNYYNEMNKPPKGLQLLYSQDGLQPEGAVNESGFSSLNESAFTSDGIQEAEIKQIYDDLDNNNSNNNHHDDDNSLLQSSHEGGAFDPAAQFDAGSVGSAHSDPGPLSLSFGDTEFTPIFTSGSGELSPAASFTDLIKVQSEDEIPWETDFSAVSNLTPGTEDDFSQDVLSRGRPTERNDIIRRPRRPVSPVGSIKSHCSLLLHIPIEEETEEDVKNELDPLPYSLKRTMSSPDLRAGSRPISSRRDKSTKELLKKLERLKRDMNVDSMNRGLPPRFPSKIGPVDSPERSAHTRTDGSLEDGTSAMGFHVDDSSAMLSELLRPDLDDAKIHRLSNEPLGSPSREEVQSLPLDVLSKELESLTKDIEHTKEIEKNSARIPAQLETSSNESWKDVISPLKDSPSKEIRKDPVTPTRKDPVTPTKESICQENWKKYMSPSKDKDPPNTLDISDDTSETDRTRSTITYDSDESSEEGGPRQIRSKSVGRARKLRKMRLLRASSLSPNRRRKPMEEGDDGSSSKNCLPLSARESRILRLQQNRKGYVSLSNDLYRNELRKGYVSLGNDRYRAESPEPYRRGLYDDPMEADPELTPKRKTAAAANDREDAQSAASSTDDLPNSLFQPTLLNPEEPCPEFDNILDHLDLQLVDLNRPIGAEYGAEEGSM